MESLPPIKKPLAALAQRSISRPAPAEQTRQTPRGEIANSAGGAPSQEFQSIDLARRTLQETKSVATPNVANSAPVGPAAASTATALGDQPQTFTLQTLSAMAGLLVERLEGASATANYSSLPEVQRQSNQVNTLAKSTAEPTERRQDSSESEFSPPGGKLNLNV